MAFEKFDFSMRQAAFDAGVALLVAGEIATLPDNDGYDNRGGETATPPSPDLSPPGLGTLMLTDGQFDRNRALAGAAA